MIYSVKTIATMTAVLLVLSGAALAQSTSNDGGAVDSSKGAVNAAPSAVNRAPSAANRTPSAVNSAPSAVNSSSSPNETRNTGSTDVDETSKR